MHWINHILKTFLLLFISLTVVAQELPDQPQPPQLVNDLANILTPNQIKTLEYKLRYFNDTTSNQIVVVTVNSLEGNDPASMAYGIGEKWHVGQKDFNNGVVVLVKPKRNSRDKGHAFIATGYGLEPVIPDATAKKIVDQEMLPYFKQGDYYHGINQATDVLMQLASGEISAKGYNKTSQSSWIVGLLPFFIIIIVIVLMGRGQRSSYGMGGSSNGLWTALFLGSMLNNRSHGGSWNHFSGDSSGGSSGFGGGGSGFGGGFSGFGGGSFGGGGAGGSW